MSVFLNNGDGTFALRTDYPAGNIPAGIFSADLDGDGDNDLAVAVHGDTDVSVLLNNGDGTFAPRVDFVVGYAPSGLTSADFDGDGDQDLVTTNYSGNSVSVLLNYGDGTFAPRVDFGVGSYSQPIVSADFDGDGDQDLAVGLLSPANSISVLLNLTIISPVGVNEREGLSSVPEIYSLSQNYPNPFNPVTTIRFYLPEAGNVELVIYDILGKEVETIVNSRQSAGQHNVVWNTSNVASGVYLYRLQANDFVQTRKMLLLK